ncbi:MAG: hypothetical protein IIA41_10655 [SAR324 cluster bacterium]|nr:hypothetical protein [SAR324 cluster bacterium]
MPVRNTRQRPNTCWVELRSDARLTDQEEHNGGEANVQRGEAGALVSRIQEVVEEQRKTEEEDSAGQGQPRPSEE